METIVHNGVTFFKATALAKKHRYTTDYIGQLCRSGKVEAKLIGRAWFVSEESLTAHKNDRYSTARPNDIIINKSLVSDRAEYGQFKRREVQSVLSKSTYRSLGTSAAHKQSPGVVHVAARPTTYQIDNSLLAPQLARTKFVTAAEASPESQPASQPASAVASGHKIKVSLGEKAVHKLPFDAIPAVTLHGNLRVASLDDEKLFAEVEPVLPTDIRFSEQKSQIKPTVILTPRYQSKKKPPVPFTSESRHSTEFDREEFADDIDGVGDFAPTTRASDFTPAVTFSPAVSRTTSSVSFAVVPVFLLVAFGITFTLLGLSNFVESDGVEFKQSTTFNFATAVAALRKLPESY